MKRGRSSNLFSQSKRPLELSHIFKYVVFRKDGKGISFRLKGHINWRKVSNFNVIWMDESIQLVKMTRLRMGKCTQMWLVLFPIFMPFCFGWCRVPQHFGGVHKQLGSLWKGKLLGFDWWKQFLLILRRSEVTINLTRPLKQMQASEFLPLLYYIVGVFSDAPSPCDMNQAWTSR
jgi:hypothetical protein